MINTNPYKALLTFIAIESISATYYHPQYGFAHRVNDHDDIESVLSHGINGIEIDVCYGYSWWDGYGWYVSHNDLSVCNNPTAERLDEWLITLKELNPLKTSNLAMLWIDIKEPDEPTMGELVDAVHSIDLPSDIKILYDLTAFNEENKAGFEQIYHKLSINEGISFCAGKSCGSDITLVDDIYDYYKSKGFTRGTFNTGDSLNIDEDFIYYANSPKFNDPLDPYRFKMVLTWTNIFYSSINDHFNSDKLDLEYTDGQIIGKFHYEWSSPGDDDYIDTFNSALSTHAYETLASASINPFTTYQRRRTYIILDTDAQTRAEAQASCMSKYGGSLATLITDNQIQGASQLRSNSGYATSESLWIGLNDISEEGEWKWESGHMCSYTGNDNCNNDDHWGEGQPDNLGGQDCAVLSCDSVENAFKDIDCSEIKGYLCDSYVFCL